MRIRAAVVDDAPAMGRVMVESWLSAHRGQMPDAAWQKRVTQWTPEVSARGWAGALAEQADGNLVRDVFLVAQDDAGVLVGLVSGSAAEDEPMSTIAEIVPSMCCRIVAATVSAGCWLRAACRALAGLGFSELHIGVLAANLPARAFYGGLGGREAGQRMFDEESYLLPLIIYAWPDINALTGSPPDDTP